MLAKRAKAEILKPVSIEALGAHGRDPDQEDRSLFGHLNALQQQLESGPDGLDYNHLSFEEKQAALALVEAGEARFRESRDGRTLLERHSPSLIKRFFSMGAYA